MSSSKSPCAACKFLRRKCTQECVFAPYFPPDQPQKFAKVHKVFGASNVSKLLNELNVAQREDAVNSLEYEAETRLRDPVYGCVGLISILQQRLKQVQLDLFHAKKELANYIGPSAMLPLLQHPGFINTNNNPSSSTVMQYNMQSVMGFPAGGAQLMIREPQQNQQMFEAQQLAAVVAAREQQEMLRAGYGGFENVAHVNQGGFNQMGGVGVGVGVGVSPALGLGSYENNIPYHQIQELEQDHSHQLQPQLLLQQHHQQPQQQQRAGSEEDKSVGPSC